MAWTRNLLPEPQRQALAGPNPRSREWRKQLRDTIGNESWQDLRAIAQGMPWQPVLPDGRLGPVQVPTTAERLEARKTLLAYAYGKPVTEDRIAHAETSQGAYTRLSELSDEEFAQLERQYLAQAAALPAGSDGPDRK